MRIESRLYLFMVLFFAVVTPVYAFMTWRLDGGVEPIGTTVLALSLLMSAMIWGYLLLTARSIDARPEDRKDAEIYEGAGTLGFFPPSSIWPFWCALVISVMFLGPVFGWWLTLVGAGFGIWAVMGWCYEFYVGAYKH